IARLLRQRPDHSPAHRLRPLCPRRHSEGSFVMTDSLITALKQLRLSGLLQSLDVRLQEAAGNSLNHAEFLELILQDELAVRFDRQLQRRGKAASFPEVEAPGGFDGSVNPAARKKQI